MADIKWTAEQELAIRTTDRDVLLTASAGAGKTAVLAQRCVYLLTEAKPPCMISELLVLTFTKAAAAEMRRRIGGYLGGRLEEEPQDGRLRRQLALLDQASISTIHAFCDALLREYFYRLALDPNYEILDGEEAELLKLQVATELFEENYLQVSQGLGSGSGSGSGLDREVFSRLVQGYGAAGTDRNLVALTIRMHNFLESLRDHEKWLADCRAMFAGEAGPAAEDLHLVGQQKQVMRARLGQIISRAEYALAEATRCPEGGTYAGYVGDYLLPAMQAAAAALEGEDWAGALEILQEAAQFKRLPNRPKGMSEEAAQPIKEQIGRIRDEYKEMLEKFGAGPQEVSRQMAATGPYARQLLELQEQFSARYQQAKRQANVLDFADLERYALQLLRGGPGGDDPEGPSDVALQLRSRYRYILVDEYQDISPVQEAIIQYLSHRGPQPKGKEKPAKGNLFMVGDVKQSIYGFRQADPEIFLDKYHRFGPAGEGGDEVRIDLNRNFRSRRGVIEGVNFIFGRCMRREFGGLDYDGAARLYYGAGYEADKGDGNGGGETVELHLVERNSAGVEETEEAEAAEEMEWLEADAERREALVIARRIQQMVGAGRPEGPAEFTVTDPQTGQVRPVQYRDVVVLMRSMRMRAEVWSEVFHQAGIPVYAELTSGYFSATEIQDMVSLLHLLDNPQQDIYLAAVLRSWLGGVDETELAEIRMQRKGGSFYQAVQGYMAGGGDAGLKNKLAGFWQRLEGWRGQARQKGLAELIWQIYTETNLPAYVSGLPEGRQRYSNLIHLHERACQFDRFARQGLARFLRFIEKLREEEGDFGPPPVLTEADNVVRILSVHKSKGLEFPVVIAAGLARLFNVKDATNAILFDRQAEAGVGMRYVQPLTQDYWPTAAHGLAAERLRQRALTEELRILYVALTRAREKLVLAAAVDAEKCRRQWRAGAGAGPLAEFVLRGAKAAIDWIGPALAGHPDGREFAGGEESAAVDGAAGRFAVSTYPAQQVEVWLREMMRQRPREGGAADWQERLEAKGAGEAPAEIAAVVERVYWQYPAERLTRLAARRTVSELKGAVDVNQEAEFAADRHAGRVLEGTGGEAGDIAGVFIRRPRFMTEQPQRPTAAQAGTWTHLFLQKLDLEQPLDQKGLEKQREKMVREGFLTEFQAGFVELAGIARFFAGPLGVQMAARRGAVQREWPFTLAVGAGELYPELRAAGQGAEEMVLVRGVIDCFYETEEGVVIIDFKTDRISPEQLEERAAFYEGQMRYYERAVGAILHKAAAEKYLYFLALGRAVRR